MIIAHAFKHAATQPIIDGLREHLDEQELELSLLPLSDVEWNLVEMISEVGIVSPVAYSRSNPDLRLLRGTCVTAIGATDDLNLYFKPGLHHVSSVACIDVSASDTILANIVLREKYNMAANFSTVPSMPTEKALEFADAVLISSPKDKSISESVLDITDEWFDMIQLPYVKFLVAGWNHSVTPKFNQIIEEIGKQADQTAIKTLEHSLNGSLTDEPEHQVPGHFRYFFDDDALEGLEQYYRYAFFHGLQKDIPDILFWEPEENAQPS